MISVFQNGPAPLPVSGSPEISAAILQLVLTLALAWLCATLHRFYRKQIYAWWAVVWLLYVLRLTSMIVFLISRDWFALYWHQALAGWTGLAVLISAYVFVRGAVRGRARWWFAVAAIFPPLWSYIAIYRLDNFFRAVIPAILFLSVASLATGVVFFWYARHVRSSGARVLAVSFVLWGLHHLDYPFLRQRGALVPWSYYLDIAFELAIGMGILLLVADDLRRGLSAMTTLSGELQNPEPRPRPVLLDALLARPLTLPAVSGAAMYDPRRGIYERGAGVCETWSDRAPAAAEKRCLAETVTSGHATTHSAWGDPDSGTAHPFAALLPIPEGGERTDALVIVGDARTPFVVLDEPFLTALGQQIGSAVANASLTESLRERTGDLERLSMRMLQQHEEERRRLSRELHDETAQVLSALKIELGVLRRVVSPSDQYRLDDALTLVDVGIRSIRAVTNELRPALLDDLGLVAALRSLATEFASRSELDVQLTVPEDGTIPPLVPDAELALFRALQEALANIARHAQARRVEITLTADEKQVTLTVADDGVGLKPKAAGSSTGGGMGLTGMRERVGALGGSMVIEPRPGGGTQLRITLGVQS